MLDLGIWLLAIAILVSMFGTFKAEGILRLISFVVLILILFAVLIVPAVFFQDGFALVLQFGIFAVPLLLLIDIILPPFPSTELLIIVPLKKYFGIPLLVGEVIVIIISFAILFMVAAAYPAILPLILMSVDFSLGAIAFYLAFFIVVMGLAEKITSSMFDQES